MKLAFILRSDIAYTLLQKLIQNDALLKNEAELREGNISSLARLEDAIEFFKADLYVLDSQSEIEEDARILLDRFQCPYIRLEGDVKTAIPLIKDHFGLQEEEEKEIPSEDPVIYDRPRKKEIVYKEKIIEKEVIRTAYQAIPSKVIVVGSLFRGAGSTTLATNLARAIAIRGLDVAYMEHPLIKPYMFDYLQIHTKDKEYVDVAREIYEQGIVKSGKNEWKQFDVKWHVIDSRKPSLTSFTYENLLVFSHAVMSNFLILDISDRWLDPEVRKFLYLADHILLCIEPDPIKYDWSAISFEYGNKLGDQRRERLIYELLSDERLHYEIVNMKYTTEIDVKTWKEVLRKKPPIANVPYLEYPLYLQNLWKSRLVYDDERFQETLEKAFQPIIARIIPKDFVERPKNKRMALSHLFGLAKK